MPKFSDNSDRFNKGGGKFSASSENRFKADGNGKFGKKESSLGGGSFSHTEEETQSRKSRKNKTPKKHHWKLWGTLLVVIAGGTFVYQKYFNTGLQPDVSYNNSKDYAVNQMMTDWNVHTTDLSSDQYGTLVQKPYISQEMKYFNRNQTRIKYFKQILSLVKFHPETSQATTRQGKVVTRRGQYVNNQFKFTIPDYKAMNKRVNKVDYSAIHKIFKNNKYSNEDYNLHDELTDMYCNYMLSYGSNIPTKTVEVNLPMVQSSRGYVIASDAKLDDVLFASPSFHSLLTSFGAVANGKIGSYKDNPEYKLWSQHRQTYEAGLKRSIIKLNQKGITNTDEVYNDLSKEAADNHQKVVNSISDDEIKSLYQKDYDKVQSGYRSDKAFYRNLDIVQAAPDKKTITFATKSLKDTANTDDSMYSKLAQASKEQADTQRAKNRVKSQNNQLKSIKKKLKKHSTAKERKALTDMKQNIKASQIMEAILVKEQSLENNPNKLSLQEQAIGLQPDRKAFIRKQQPNPAYTDWNSLSVKTGLPQPTKTINQPLKAQQNIPFDWIGANYLLHDYTDINGKHQVIEPQQGDGSPSWPATINTVVQTKGMGAGGQPHDIKVRLTGILQGKKADNYVANIDSRNEGFDTKADYTLVVIQFQVQNLEKQTNRIHSGYQLVDNQGNPIARSGSLYSLNQTATIKGKKVATMEDWFYTQDPNSLYLTWGKGFNKKYPLKWFKTLGYNNPKVTHHPAEQ